MRASNSSRAINRPARSIRPVTDSASDGVRRPDATAATTMPIATFTSASPAMRGSSISTGRSFGAMFGQMIAAARMSPFLALSTTFCTIALASRVAQGRADTRQHEGDLPGGDDDRWNVRDLSSIRLAPEPVDRHAAQLLRQAEHEFRGGELVAPIVAIAPGQMTHGDGEVFELGGEIGNAEPIFRRRAFASQLLKTLWNHLNLWAVAAECTDKEKPCSRPALCDDEDREALMVSFSYTPIMISGYSFVNVEGVSPGGLVTGINETTIVDNSFIDNNGAFSNIVISGGLSVFANGISSSGEVYGTYTVGLAGGGVTSGFIDTNGTIYNISYSGGTSSFVKGIDDAGDIVGQYYTSNGTAGGFIDQNGTYMALNPSGSTNTYMGGVSADGAVFGQFVNSTGYHGFVYLPVIGFSTIDVPGATGTSVTGDMFIAGPVTGGAAFGEAVGVYTDSAGNSHGFIDINGSISTINGPGATNTSINGINEAGEIVGSYISGSQTHGFVYKYGVLFTVDVPGASGTSVAGVNAAGEIYGSYSNNAGTFGFVGTLPLSAAGPTVHANNIALSGGVTGPYNFIDLLNLEASYGDLINAFGTNEQAMQSWFNANEPAEKRPDSFDGLDYVASYGDLTNAFKGAGSEQAVLDDGAEHYITNGVNEGRTTSFNGLDYIASYGDLIKAFGVNGDAGAYHYIEYGSTEGRTTTFDGLDYIASYTDLSNAFGADEQAGAQHFIQYGFNEGRTTTFDGLDYIAGYTDLMTAFGANNDAGATHYIDYGLGEGRTADAFNVAAYESAHPDLIGQFTSNDAFLTAYINTYTTTGKFLT